MEGAIKPSSPNEFTAVVNLSNQTRLGVDADWADGKTLFIKAVLSGAVEEWNNQHPDIAIRSGDRIIAVNNSTGDAQAMVKECRDKTVLSLVVRRGDVKEPEASPSPEPSFGGPGSFAGAPNVPRPGMFIPGAAPPRVVDMLIDLRAKAEEKKGSTDAKASPGSSPTGGDAGGDQLDHYKVLGATRQADEESIKKCYRKLVLQWHPDKHPADRAQAEVKIRLINNAYETLGNPLKRSTYDQMLAAIERRRLGVRLETSFIKPRMSIPKEFMLCPIGHPDKFVRVVDQVLKVQSREDVPGLGFQEFFQQARFSLWWLPEVNNMCRLRARDSAGQGVDGGLNLNFSFQAEPSDTQAEGEVSLSSLQEMKRANLMVNASPYGQGAYRFEGAFWPERFLTFRTPSTLCMAPVADERTSETVDFMLVDYSAAFKFMTTTEVLKGAVESQAGSTGGYVKLSDLRADLSVRMYFQQMLGCAVWNNKDFETFFEGHYATWDFDIKKARVRWRPESPSLKKDGDAKGEDAKMGDGSPEADLQAQLRACQTQKELAKTLLACDKEVLPKISPMISAETLLRLAEPPQPEGYGGRPPFASELKDLAAARSRIVTVLPAVLEDSSSKARSRSGSKEGSEQMQLGLLLNLHRAIAAIAATENGGEELPKACKNAAELVADLVAVRLRQVPDELELEVLPEIILLPMEWKAAADPLNDAVAPLLGPGPNSQRGPGLTLEALRAAGRAGSGARPVAEALARWEMKGIQFAEPALAADILIAIVESGVQLQAVAQKLRPPFLQRLPLPELVVLCAMLAERKLDADLLRPPLQARVAVAGPALTAVPPANLVRLATAAARSTVVAECALGAVAGAAAVTLTTWPPENVAELLLVVATTIASAGDAARNAVGGARKLYAYANEYFVPQLSKLSSKDLLKAVAAAGAAAGQCKPILEAAAGVATSRLADLKPDEVLVLTSGTLSLGQSHPTVKRLLSYWGEVLDVATGETGPEAGQAVPPVAQPGTASPKAASGQFNGPAGGGQGMGWEGSNMGMGMGPGGMSVPSKAVPPRPPAPPAPQAATPKAGAVPATSSTAPSKAKVECALPADDMAQLAMLLSLVAPSHPGFFQSIGSRLLKDIPKLTEAGKKALDQAFPEGGGPDFQGKEELLKAAAEEVEKKKKSERPKRPPRGDRSRSRSRSPKRRKETDKEGSSRTRRSDNVAR